MRYLYSIIAGIFALLTAGDYSPCLAQSTQEYKVKAAFIVNFARFTKWPPNTFATSGQPLAICLAGEDPFGSSLFGIENQIIHGRKVAVKRFSSLMEVADCQVVFIHASEKENVSSFQQQQHDPILTVSDIDGFLSLGGMIEFIRVGNKLSFQINNSLVKEQSMKIEASLLGLAKEVY